MLLAVGLFVHQITRSRVLIDVLYSLGFSVSYDEVINFERNAAVSSADSMDSDDVETSRTSFLQFIADNFDHNEDTKTGDNTTHVMGIISSHAPQAQSKNTTMIKREKLSATKMTSCLALGHLVKPYEKPVVSRFKDVKLKTVTLKDLDLTVHQVADTFWQISGMFINTPPNWQGFMASIVHGNPTPSDIKFYPPVTLNPSSYEAVYITLSFVSEEVRKQRICCTSLTFDQPLYWKASEIIADKAPEFTNIHLKLGGFHQLMSFMGDSCKLMEESGISELWSTVYKENSIPKMLSGKAYSRCLRASLLTCSALHCALLGVRKG